MSIEAISWTFKLEIKPSSLKFLLVALANFSNTDGQVWPSIELLCRMTSQNRKTIITGISKLEELGYLIDTCQRKGQTSKIKVYNFCNPSDKSVFSETNPKTVLLNSPKNGGLIVPKTDGNSTENGKSPIPPYTEEPSLNLQGTKKINNKKSPKMSLTEWEDMAGAKLCAEMIKGWIKDQRLDEREIPALIAQFRDRVLAGGNQYADFKAAFRVWLRDGYLKKTLLQIQLVATVAVSGAAEKWERGTSL
jgi:hypothetical protein